MLYEIFNSVGPVASIRVCRDSVSRKSLGYGYVNFHSVSDAERALDTLNYSSIKGRACRIMWSQRDPSLRKSGLGNVFVRNLDRNIDNKALYDTFSLFGNILSCKVCTGPDGKSRGYGFVHYETEEAAKQAIERVDGMQIGEKTVGVSGFVKRQDREKPAMNTFTNIYIKNFPDDWAEDKLKAEFAPHGSITSSHVTTDNKGRKSAFINYETHDQAVQAISTMHQKDCRTDEQKEADKEKEDEEKDRTEKSYLLYVARAQSKYERQMELKEKMPPKDPAAGQSRSQGVNLYIKNLDEATDDDSLRALFEPFGNITSVVAMKEGNGKCKGFGFVCFSSPDEATKAVTEMHLKVVKGKPLYVGLAEKRDVRAERLRGPADKIL
ncbi:pabpc1-a [Symbiodinium sp. KB8]|nr:pabpc1-a [Symbiodinium sp. KB8]